MARLPRLAIAGYLHHVLQSGHNSAGIFVDDLDRQALLDILDASARRFGVAIHAWVWLPNRFHLLATPLSTESLPRMMQALGRDYVQRFNGRHARTGTLWSGRYRCSILEAQAYALPCMVFLDLLPVSTGLADQASDYLWSSHRHFAGIQRSAQLGCLSPHPAIWQLGNTPFAREAMYRERVDESFGSEKFGSLTDAVRGGWALGSSLFVAEIQRLTLRRVSKASPGRPAKSDATAKSIEP
jgi:putative transposase